METLLVLYQHEYDCISWLGIIKESELDNYVDKYIEHKKSTYTPFEVIEVNKSTGGILIRIKFLSNPKDTSYFCIDILKIEESDINKYTFQ